MLHTAELMQREQLKLLKQTCLAQSILVPLWSLIFVALLSGILPVLGHVPFVNLAMFMILIILWAGFANLTSRKIDLWLTDNKLQTATVAGIVLFAGNGIIGGAAFWIFWAEGNVTTTLFLCMAMLIIISVYSIELNSYLPTFAAGIFSLGIIVFARFVTSNNEVASIFSYLLPGIIAWYFYMGLRGHRNLVAHISTRLEKETLNSDLKQTTQRLKKSLADSEIASQAKDTFFASMSHDLQTPLTAISGFNQALGQQIFGPLNAKQREYTDHIDQASRHLQNLIRDVLTISSLRSGEYEVNCEKTDLRVPIKQAVDILQGAYPQTSETLITDMPDTPVFGLIDAGRFVECVLNLLTNAVKYSPKEAPITLLLEVGTDYHRVHIIDTGEGMTEEEIAAALKPFARIKSSNISGNQGTGLGLPIVNQLMEKQNGQFKLVARKSGGMQATLYTPAAHED